jgi:hypothetical protein
MQVHFSKKSQKTLFAYIKRYQSFLIKDFYDTGIIAEEQIRESYIRE